MANSFWVYMNVLNITILWKGTIVTWIDVTLQFRCLHCTLWVAGLINISWLVLNSSKIPLTLLKYLRACSWFTLVSFLSFTFSIDVVTLYMHAQSLNNSAQSLNDVEVCLLGRGRMFSVIVASLHLYFPLLVFLLINTSACPASQLVELIFNRICLEQIVGMHLLYSCVVILAKYKLLEVNVFVGSI